MEAVSEGEPEAPRGPQGPCWLPGELWTASLGLGVMLLLAGLTLGLSGSWEASSVTVVVSLILLAALWDRPTARFPLALLLLGIDAGSLARAGGLSLLVPPVYIASDRMGSTLALDPALAAILADAASRALRCRRSTPQRNKNPPRQEAPMVPR